MIDESFTNDYWESSEGRWIPTGSQKKSSKNVQRYLQAVKENDKAIVRLDFEEAIKAMQKRESVFRFLNS